TLVDELHDQLAGAGPFSGSGTELPPGLRELRRQVHQTIHKVTVDIESRFHFNTAIAAMMELVNELYLARDRQDMNFEAGPQAALVWREAIDNLLLMLSPMVPHFAEELWQVLGHSTSLLLADWPIAQPEAQAAETRLVVIQINGKLRSKIEVPVTTGEDEMCQLALEDPRIKDLIQGQKPKKVVVARKKLVNIVI
ncbi:MAG: class I tRNA ligase family protein, partial [Desulfobacca sp.]|nr:class I tRNA ligase family protein [Desulfobacca sp.]